jgi:hypothetical protein
VTVIHPTIESMVLTSIEVRQHLREEESLTDLEKLVLEDLNKVRFLKYLENVDVRAELLDLLPCIFEARLDACIFCDTLPVSPEEAKDFFHGRLSAENEVLASNLARQLRGDEPV